MQRFKLPPTSAEVGLVMERKERTLWEILVCAAAEAQTAHFLGEEESPSENGNRVEE